MRILNLTQHAASDAQRAAGVVDVDPEYRDELTSLLTFGELPTPADLRQRAQALAAFADDQAGTIYCVMVGGAPYFMATLADALRSRGITPLFAFSKRESVDVVQPDGSTVKRAAFRHLGWVKAI